MPDGSLRIKIGASVDSSVSTAFASIEKAAKRAAALIAKDFAGAGGNAARGLKALPEGLKKTGDEAGVVGKKAKDAGKALASMATLSAEKFAQLQTTLKGMPASLAVVSREAKRALADIERQNARAMLGLGGGRGGGGGGEWGGGRNSRYWFSPSGNFNIKRPTMTTLEMDPIRGMARFGMGAASFMRRSAMNVATGMGVETDIGSMFRKNMEDQSLATKISSSGFMPGMAGANGSVVDPRLLQEQARGIGISTGTESGEVLGGLRKFVGLTGDLELGRTILKDMAVLSRATGSNLEQMSQAAAEVSNNIGDIPNKGQAIDAIMRNIAGQGKLGAVEIRDMARNMAKIASTAQMYKGSVAGNIAMLGVFAQESKLRGGSSSATQAATSVSALSRDLTSSRALKGWKKLGVSAFTDDTHSLLKGPQELIKDALGATGGDLTKLKMLFPNASSMRAVQGFANVSREAGGGAKGLAAVDAEIARLQSAQLSQEEVIRAFNKSMQTSEAKVKVFNEQMGAVAEQLAGVVLPAFEALAPVLVGLASTLVTKLKDFFALDNTKPKIETGLAIDQDVRNVRGSITKTNVGGREIGEMSAEGKLLMESDAEKADKAVKDQEAQVAKDKADIEKNKLTWGPGSNALGKIVDFGWSTALGKQTNSEQAATKLAEDQRTLALLLDTNTNVHGTLKSILTSIDEGLLYIKAAPPPTPPKVPGVAPAETGP